jgi:hypothetical protein
MPYPPHGTRGSAPPEAHRFLGGRLAAKRDPSRERDVSGWGLSARTREGHGRLWATRRGLPLLRQGTPTGARQCRH